MDIEKTAKSYFSNEGCHNWDHTKRVLNLCLHIAKTEKNVDMDVLKKAALLHDIGRADQDNTNGELCHAEKGADLAREVLGDYMKTEEIIHCIKSHRFRKGEDPKTIEAKILFDADKLDAIGATGIGRAFLFAGEIGAKLHNKKIKGTRPYTKEDTAYREFKVKLSKIKDKMLTKEGKRLAEQRHKFMNEFFERLNNEVEGKL